MCLGGDLPQEIATKRLQKPLLFLYGTFFGLSVTYIIFAFILLTWWIKVQDVYFPFVLLYNIIESCMFFCCKRYNKCITIIFRFLIGVYDCVILIDIIRYTVKYDIIPYLIGFSILHLCALITNCSVLFIFARLPRKGPWYSMQIL